MDKEIIETKKYVDEQYRFRIPCKTYSYEFIVEGVSRGNLCIKECILYNIDKRKKLVKHTIQII